MTFRGFSAKAPTHQGVLRIKGGIWKEKIRGLVELKEMVELAMATLIAWQVYYSTCVTFEVIGHLGLRKEELQPSNICAIS